MKRVCSGWSRSWCGTGQAQQWVEQKLSLDNESKYGGARLGDQDQEVLTDAATGRGCGRRDRSCRGKATWSRAARVPRRRRRAAMDLARKDVCRGRGWAVDRDQEPGHRLDRLCVRADPGDHIEEARGWWNSGASVRSYRWTARWRIDRGEGAGSEGTSVVGRGGPTAAAEEGRGEGTGSEGTSVAMAATEVAAEGDMGCDHRGLSSGRVGEKLSLDSEERRGSEHTSRLTLIRLSLVLEDLLDFGGSNHGMVGPVYLGLFEGGSSGLSAEDPTEGLTETDKLGTEGHAPSGDDQLTPAERRYIDQRERINVKRLAKTANKSHRDRIQDFNQYLANLSEHYDIPKVGPG
ncbi:hypothetical protein B296_00035915 [Ensete ventricosum]|uniref:Protein FAM32A n=1 Tax=Ensete ventricosum TaxID=4639 RepID=A0A426YKD7_ENSVE|nr:hypothetical protein B296_00035915 [Ensete ventricosum]